MKAVKFENQRITMMEVPLPQTAGSEVLVKVMMAGICATDFQLYLGYQDYEGIPGHEFVGMVEQAPQAPWLVGKRVVADINVGCGKCPHCQNGNARHCPSRSAIGIRGRNGAFAEYCAVPARNLVVLPDHLETIDAVFAEPLAAALEITRQIHICRDTRIAVLGDGKMGQLCALVLDQYSGNLMLLGRHADKLAHAAGQGISTCALAATAMEAVEPGWESAFDVVVEATGNPDAINLAMALVRPEGRIVVKTTAHRSASMNLSTLVVNEIMLVGSRCGDIGFAVKWLANQRIQPASLVEQVYPFSDFQSAFEHAMTKGSRKVLLIFE